MITLFGMIILGWPVFIYEKIELFDIILFGIVDIASLVVLVGTVLCYIFIESHKFIFRGKRDLPYEILENVDQNFIFYGTAGCILFSLCIATGILFFGNWFNVVTIIAALYFSSVMYIRNYFDKRSMN